MKTEAESEMNGLGVILALMSAEARARICRATLSQLWLSEPEFRAKIEDKLKHVMHADQFEAHGESSFISRHRARKEQMTYPATEEAALDMGSSPIRRIPHVHQEVRS